MTMNARKHKNAFETKDGDEAIPAEAMRETVCAGCSKTVSEGALCLWVMGKGIFHEECVVEAAS